MFGGGYRNPQMRYLRYGLLAAVLVAGVAFNHSGRTYEVIRGVYLVLIVGGILYSLSRRSARSRNLPGGGWGGRGGLPGAGRQGPAGTWPPANTWPGETVDVQTRPNNPAGPAFGEGAGWFPDPNDASLERYWDGTNWAQSRNRSAGGHPES